MTSERWTRVEPTKVHPVGWRTVVTKHFELPDGTVTESDTVGAEGSRNVAVIALTSEKEVVVARLFRPGPEEVMIELPGGGVDDGETPEAAGIRELGEETGYMPGDDSEITELTKPEGIPHQDGYSNIRKHYFMITNVVLGQKQKHEVEETIIVDKIPIKQLFSNAREGHMTDAVAVLLAHDTLREIEKGVANDEKTN
jgi:ADP-ribose pyrophosphatase